MPFLIELFGHQETEEHVMTKCEGLTKNSTVCKLHSLPPNQFEKSYLKSVILPLQFGFR